jgi:hypothetical protein
MGPLLQTGQGYHIKGFVQYMGNQATGAAVMSWGSASGLVLGATQVGYQIFTGGGVSPIIHNSSGTLGAVTGPVFAANTTNWLFDFDIYVTVATAGSLTLRAAENSAGNPFVINQAYATIEHF